MSGDEAKKTLAVVRYRFDASPEDVFDAWLLPEIASKWWFTSPTSKNHSAEIDGRVGGKYKIVDERDGETYTAVGEFTEIDRPRRIAFTFCMPQFADEVDVITVDIDADGDGSWLTLKQACYRDFKTPSENGWGKMFVMLANILRAQGAT